MTITKDIFDNLPYDKRLTLAEDPTLPVGIMESLITSSEWGLRFQLAQNPNMPTRLLASLVGDSNSNVRFMVVRHPNTTPEILIKTWEYEKNIGKSPTVFRMLYYNKGTPAWVKASLYVLFHEEVTKK